MGTVNKQQVPILYTIGLVSFILFFMEIELAWSYPKSVFKYIAILSLTFHVFLSLNKYNSRQLILLALLALLVVYVGFNAQQITLLCLSFALIVGAKDIEFKQILKIHFYTGLFLCLISVIGSSIGLIENKANDIGIDSMEMLGSSTSRRYSYGYVWPTDCANHISFVCIAFFLIREGVLKIRELFFLSLVFLFVFLGVKARQSASIVLLILLLSLYLRYLRKKQKNPYRFILFLFIFSIPLLAAISIYATLAYDETDMAWVVANIVLTGRLRLGQDAIEEYGIPWFGQYIKMIGADANKLEYNYVDSSYLQAYLLWGIVLATILIGQLFIVCKRAYSRKDSAMLFAVFLAGLSSVTSQFLFQIMFSPFLLALLSNHQNTSIDYVKKRTTETESP